jgi:hypothetical protein
MIIGRISNKLSLIFFCCSFVRSLRKNFYNLTPDLYNFLLVSHYVFNYSCDDFNALIGEHARSEFDQLLRFYLVRAEYKLILGYSSSIS